MLKPWYHMLSLDMTAAESIHQQLITHFTTLIQQGFWLQDSPLPSTREISQQLGINRKTATRVYEELAVRGLIYSLPKRGTFVSPWPNVNNVAAGNELAGKQLAQRASTQSAAMQTDDHENAQQIIWPVVLQHTRRAALHMHKLKPADYDVLGLMSLRQMLALLLAHEKRTLISPNQLLCTNWQSLQMVLMHLLKTAAGSGTVLVDAKLAPGVCPMLEQAGLTVMVLSSIEHLPTEQQIPAYIEQLEKFCINYPVSALWMNSQTLAGQQSQWIQLPWLANKLRDYQLWLVEDIRANSLSGVACPTLTAHYEAHSLLVGNLYGACCETFNLHYLAVPEAMLTQALERLDIAHQMPLLLNMLAHSELIKRGDYKKIKSRLQSV